MRNSGGKKTQCKRHRLLQTVPGMDRHAGNRDQPRMAGAEGAHLYWSVAQSQSDWERADFPTQDISSYMQQSASSTLPFGLLDNVNKSFEMQIYQASKPPSVPLVCHLALHAAWYSPRHPSPCPSPPVTCSAAVLFTMSSQTSSRSLGGPDLVGGSLEPDLHSVLHMSTASHTPTTTACATPMPKKP